MVACSQIQPSATATDHPSGLPNSNGGGPAIMPAPYQFVSPASNFMPSADNLFCNNASSAGSTNNLFTPRQLISSTAQRHSSSSSTASTSIIAADSSDCSNQHHHNQQIINSNLLTNNNNNNNASAASSSAASTSSHGSTTSSGRRHGKRQKGQPYIPSYMDLSTGPEPCVVCGDAATGYHYRAMTCEGCKGFFRRTIQKGLKYDCKFGGGCSVDKRTRNQCQQCRYIRCLNVGMAADLVLNEGERLAKRRLIEQNRQRRKVNSGSEKSQQAALQSDSNMSSEKTQSSNPATIPPSVVEKVPSIMTFLKQEEEPPVVKTQPLTSPKIDNDSNCGQINNNNNNNSSNQLTGEEQVLIDAVVASYSNTLLRLGDHLRKQQQFEPSNGGKKSWRQLTELLAPAIVKVVEFAKALPGFAELDNADQVLLLRSGCIEVLCLRVASRPSFKSRLQLAKRKQDEQDVKNRNDKEETVLAKQQDEMASLIEPIIEFSSGISKLALDTTETALLAAVLLMQSDRSGLLQPDRVEQCQDGILSAYRKYVCQRRPQHPFHWAKILMKVTDVRAISLKYSEKVLSVSVDDSTAPELPSLVLEMLYDDQEQQTPQQHQEQINMANQANNQSSKIATVHDDYCSSGDDDDRQSTTNNITCSASSYASSTHSPFTSSDIPSSPFSYAGSSSSSGSGRPAVPSGGGPNNQMAASSTTLSHLWHPASPTESHAESVISSSSGSGRSALSPPPQPPLDNINNTKTSPTSAFALHQLASIALDPMFYRPFIAASQAWPAAALFLPPPIDQTNADKANPGNFYTNHHSQMLAAAAAALASSSVPVPVSANSHQATGTNNNNTQSTNNQTPPGAQSSKPPNSLKSSKYSISSLIA